jgi:3-phosphoshikimate 1-carboxyvinyltransferase
MSISLRAFKKSVDILPSKSQSVRALIFALLATGRSTIQNLLPSPDIEAIVTGCQQLGALIERTDTTLYMTGTGGKLKRSDRAIDVGNSGLGLRFFTAISTLSPQPITITGDHSICNRRPSQPLMEALLQLGASVTTIKNNGFAPLVVQGPLEGGRADIDGRDSQPVSALIVATLFANRDSVLHVQEAGERPYIDMTLQWLDRLKLSYSRKEYDRFYVPAGQRIPSFHYRVPADFSTATFLVAAALITHSEVELLGLDFDEPQGDKAFFSIVEEMGATVLREKQRIIVRSKGVLRAIHCDLNSSIDSVPIIAVLAAYAQGKTKVFGVRNACFKECDRLNCTAKELRKLGVKVDVFEDALEIEGGAGLQGGTVYSHEDHRLAMALLIGGLGAKEQVRVEGTECIKKSYPTFFNDFLAYV